MNNSEVFFIISSVGFVTLWILIAIVLAYILRAVHTFSRIITRVERDINTIGDTTKELLEDMQTSSVYKFLFGRRKQKAKKE